METTRVLVSLQQVALLIVVLLAEALSYALPEPHVLKAEPPSVASPQVGTKARVVVVVVGAAVVVVVVVGLAAVVVEVVVVLVVVVVVVVVDTTPDASPASNTATLVVTTGAATVATGMLASFATSVRAFSVAAASAPSSTMAAVAG